MQASEALLLMPCSATKNPSTTPMPAHELYDGPMWRTLRTYRGALPWQQVIVLSGLYGLVHAEQQLRTYECSLTEHHAQRIVDAGLRGRSKGARFSPWDVCGCAGRLRHYRHVMIAGAGEYRRVFEWLAIGLQEAGAIGPDATLDVVRGGIGEQRGQLGQWLRGLEA